MRSQMELDVQDYELKGIGDLCNRILADYEFFPQPQVLLESDTLYKNVPPLQFSLNRDCDSFAIYANNQDVSRAELCRYFFQRYIDMPRGMRENFLFAESVKKLKKAIKSRVNVHLVYRGEQKTVAPCFFAYSPSQVRTYLVVCDDDETKAIPDRFRSLRLCYINSVALDTSEAYHCKNFKLSRQAEIFNEHFDPFLCHGKTITARLTDKGAKLYNKLTTNRPKVISTTENSSSATSSIDNAGDYIFECSEKLAKVYFPQFLNEAEILEPRELRLWFKEQFDNASKVYKR